MLNSDSEEHNGFIPSHQRSPRMLAEADGACR
jgi:hypothetical protein